jgi:aminopeptidase N
MELKETKGRDLWREQLGKGPRVIDRIRAAKALGDKSSDEDVQRLGEALLYEKFWGVGEVIASALGTIGGEKARDQLLAAVTMEHPKTRRAVVEQLGKFVKDERVTQTLRQLIAKGDPSYRVEAAAIASFSKMQAEGAVDILTSVLDRPSHQEQIRSAALTGLGRTGDSAALRTLLDWMQRGKPRECRRAAVEGLSLLAQDSELPEEARQSLVTALAESLEGERPRFQRAAISALRDLGEKARPAIPALRLVQASGSDDRIRRAAADAIERISAAAPPPMQLQELRDELAKLREANKAMREQIERLEAKGEHAATN